MVSGKDEDPVSSLGESRIITEIFLKGKLEGPPMGVGPGDDGAVFSPGAENIVVTTDMLVEGVHFDTAYFPPGYLGEKCVKVNVSDLAAMGAIPHSAYLSIGLRPSTKTGWLREFASGLRKSLRFFKMAMGGGDTVRSDRLTFSVTAVGTLNGAPVTRVGAKPGDIIFLSGTPGLSHLGMRILEMGRRPLREYAFPERRAIKCHLDPRIDVGLGSFLRKNKIATSMIDTSDGLVTDLNRILEASGVGAEIDLSGLKVDDKIKDLAKEYRMEWEDLVYFGGEDYNLLFTVSPRKIEALRQWEEESRLKKIGCITRGKGIHTALKGSTPDVNWKKNSLFRHFEPEESKVN
jgi:thiamine-monophosphate kinase